MMNLTQPPEILLASASPRRRELLDRLGIAHFTVAAPQTQEVMDPALSPAALVEGLSLQKARAVDAPAGAVVIAADTIVVLGNLILGKPTDAADAARMLAALSGKTHQVYTGLSVLCGAAMRTAHEVTDVTFRLLDEKQIADYIATGEPLDKAGAYGIQGVGASLVVRLAGDYYNVMGLPAARLCDMLAEFGIDLLALAAARAGQ